MNGIVLLVVELREDNQGVLIAAILRKEYFWEHLGRMDDPGYIFRTTRKMSAYLSNDYYLGDHLILTLETKDLPLNTRHIKKIIEHYFL